MRCCETSHIPTATFPSEPSATLRVVSISCRSGHPGINRGIADLGALDAWPLQDTLIDHAQVGELIAETVRTRGWLIFYSHDVADEPSRWGVSPDLLEWAVGTAKRAGCVLASVAQVSLILSAAGLNHERHAPASPHRPNRRCPATARNASRVGPSRCAGRNTRRRKLDDAQSDGRYRGLQCRKVYPGDVGQRPWPMPPEPRAHRRG